MYWDKQATLLAGFELICLVDTFFPNNYVHLSATFNAGSSVSYMHTRIEYYSQFRYALGSEDCEKKVEEDARQVQFRRQKDLILLIFRPHSSA